MTIKNISIALLVIGVLLGVASFFGGHVSSFGAITPVGSTEYNTKWFVNGLFGGATQQWSIDANGNEVANTITSTGATVVGALTQGGGTVATSSTGAGTLTAANLTTGTIQHTNAGATTLTLPASTTLTTFIPTAGQCAQIVILNVGTGIDTIAGGTGSLLATASSTKNVNVAGMATLDACRKVNTDVQFLLVPGV